jgi:hypothetical protein
MAIPAAKIGDYSNFFGRMRPTIKNSRGLMLIDFIKSLQPNYAVVYRDIAIGYVALAARAGLAVTAETSETPFWVITPLTST